MRSSWASRWRVPRDLAHRARAMPDFHYHYVTAREMYNLVKAAEAGWSGTVAEALDYHLIWDGMLAPRHPVATSVIAPGETAAS